MNEVGGGAGEGAGSISIERAGVVYGVFSLSNSAGGVHLK
jgi:hypothetical protein